VRASDWLSLPLPDRVLPEKIEVADAFGHVSRGILIDEEGACGCIILEHWPVYLAISEAM
jgi:hypothetical protein